MNLNVNGFTELDGNLFINLSELEEFSLTRINDVSLAYPRYGFMLETDAETSVPMFLFSEVFDEGGNPTHLYFRELDKEDDDDYDGLTAVILVK